MSSDDSVPTSAGLTSFNLLDEKQFFEALPLKAGMQFLDFGCGVGNYTIAAAPYVGKGGRLYAFDLWDEGIETLEIRTAMAGLDNISTKVCKAGDRLPIEDHVIDLCLLATVVHILVLEGLLAQILQEIRRVMKPLAKVAVVEFYKREGSPGPPFEWRLSPDDLKKIMVFQGFDLIKTSEVGPYNYLSLFTQKNNGQL